MSSSPELSLEGRAEGQPASAPWRIFLGITGLSLLLGLGKLFARFVLGRKREARITLRGDKLTLEDSTRAGGREISAAKETFGRAKVVSARLETRYPFLPSLLGMMGLGVGVAVGLVWLLDGIQGEFTPWILGGIGVLLAGIALDLALTSLAASMPGKTTVSLYLPNDRTIRVVGCDPKRAEELVLWLHES